MVEISLSGSGEGPEGAIPRGYSTTPRQSASAAEQRHAPARDPPTSARWVSFRGCPKIHAARSTRIGVETEVIELTLRAPAPQRVYRRPSARRARRRCEGAVMSPRFPPGFGCCLTLPNPVGTPSAIPPHCSEDGTAAGRWRGLPIRHWATRFGNQGRNSSGPAWFPEGRASWIGGSTSATVTGISCLHLPIRVIHLSPCASLGTPRRRSRMCRSTASRSRRRSPYSPIRSRSSWSMRSMRSGRLSPANRARRGCSSRSSSRRCGRVTTTRT